MLLSHIRERLAAADELVRSARVEAGDVAAALTEVELAGSVTLEGGRCRSTV